MFSSNKIKKRRFSYRLSPMRYTLESILVISLVLPLCGFKFVSELQNEKANALYKKGQIGKAKTEYARALKTDPSSSQISYNLGNALFREGAFKDSQATYQKAVAAPAGGESPPAGRRAGASSGKEQDPLFQAKAFHNLGNSFYRQKDLPNAAEAYKKALRLNPKDVDTKYNLEFVLKQLEKEKKDDPKKDDQKKEDKKKDEQEKKDQNKDQQNQGGGSQGSQGQEPQESKGGQGENKDESGTGQGSSGGKDRSGKDREGKTKEGEEDKGQEQEGKEQKAERQEKESLGSEGSKEEKAGPSGEEASAQPKAEAQIRAEQILNALENQEQQVLKFQNSQIGPQTRVRRVSEQDW